MAFPVARGAPWRGEVGWKQMSAEKGAKEEEEPKANSWVSNAAAGEGRGKGWRGSGGGTLATFLVTGPSSVCVFSELLSAHENRRDGRE